MEYEIYTGFSSPRQAFSPAFANILAVEHGRAVTRAFLDHHGDAMNRAGDGLTTLIEHWLDSDASFEHVWHPALGELREALRPDGPIHPLRAGSSFGLHLTGLGLGDGWRMSVGAAAVLRWRDHALPPCDRIRVARRGDGVRLTLEHGGNPVDGAAATPLPSLPLGDGRAIVVYPQAVLSHLVGDFAARVGPGDLAALAEALALLRQYAPPYETWVQRIVRGVIPLVSEGGMIFSSSYEGRPGVISISFPAEPVALAEMLVHEASHQYLHLLSRLGALDDGSDTTLYDSPVKRCPRPIGAILLAYHAFANVQLFYRAALARGIDDAGYCERNARELAPQLVLMEEWLCSTTALTPLGRALWEPLAAELRAAR
jgi:HEXXH motif-containing protein